MVAFAAILASGWALASDAPTRSYAVELVAPSEIKAILEKNLQIHVEIAAPGLTDLRFDFLVRRTEDEIKSILMTEGYFSAVVGSRVEKQDDRSIARFDVQPGTPSRISRVDIQFRGAITEPGAENEQRRRELGRSPYLRTNETFRSADWEKGKETLLRELRSRRFPAARIAESEALVDPEAHSAALRIVLDSGPVFTFGELAIDGLNTLPSSIVSGLNRIRPGSLYSEQELVELQRRLQQTNYFRSVFVTTPTDAAAPERVPIRVSVVENTARSVRLGAGFNTDTGAGVEARYEDNLTFRPGWRSRSVLRLDQREQLAGAELYLLPILGGLQPRLDAQIKQTDIQNEITLTSLIAARLARPGFNSEWSVALELRHERKETGGLLLSEVTSIPLNFSWTRRVLDDVLYPRKGFVLNLQAGGGPLSGADVTDDRFTRVYGKANAYWPVGARATLILRGEVGAVQGASRQYVPSDYLFRAGGSQSVRGYAYGKLGIDQNGAIVPGRYIGVASVELSQPVTTEWGVALFFDAGNVVDRRQDFSAERGYGVGVRWRSPLGPLNVDLAYGEAEKELRLHFSVGITF